ncbi:MAG: putative Ig domain-containing protein, partial [bacterium]|nr:putative Ig domain-containing protein [Candidatus Colisoma equi]
YLDMSAFFSFKNDSGRLVEFTKSIIAHIPMKLYDGQIYSVSRQHNGVTEVLPMWYEGIDDDEDVAATNEWVKADVANQELVVKTRRFCDYALGTLELEKTCTITVNGGSKTLGEADPASLATNFQIRVTGALNVSDFAGYCKRAKGEGEGDYAINFVCTKMPQGYTNAFTVVPGTFTIDPAEMIEAEGKVTYPKAQKDGCLKQKAKATWKAKAAKGCVFTGWTAADGAPDAVTNHLDLSWNELRDPKLSFKVAKDELIEPTDVAATWAHIDEDLIGGVSVTTNSAGEPTGLAVETLSHVTASVKGLPKGLKFTAKTLAITGTPTKNGTFMVTVSVKNASGYTWKGVFTMKVSGKAVVEIVPPAEESVTRKGVSVMIWCDAAMGSATGTGVYALPKKLKIKATPKKGYEFAGWYWDPGFSEPVTTFDKGKDYRGKEQSLVLTGPTYLFARFVEKTTKADPITWRRYAGAGYCGADASVFAADETWYQGVKLPADACQIAFGSLTWTTVKVSGLPKGVKFDTKTLRFTGVPTKAGFYTVKVSVSNRCGSTDVLKVPVTVVALPKWAVGNFDGYHMENGTTNGTFAATVGKTGKVSGKTKGGLAATTFSAKSFASVKLVAGALCYIADVTVSYKDPLTKKTVKEPDTFYVMENPETGLGMIGGGDKDGNGCVAVQRAWSRKDLGLPAFPSGKKALTLELDNGIKLKFGANGKVTLAGKVTGDNGKSITVSGTTYVLPFAWQDAACLRTQVYVYVAPKKNLADGVSEVCDVYLTTNADGKLFAAASFTPPPPPEP